MFSLSALFIILVTNALHCVLAMPTGFEKYPWKALYDNKTPESPEFGCKQAAVDPMTLCNPLRVHEGTQGKTHSHIDNECVDLSEQKVIKLFKRAAFSELTFMREMDGLKRARQLLDCQYTITKETNKYNNEVHIKRYYLFQKKIHGESLSGILKYEGFSDLRRAEQGSPKWTALEQAIRSKFIWYAQHYGVGHKDPMLSNIKIQGKTDQNYKIDLIDWAQWMDVRQGDAEALAAYVAWLDTSLPQNIRRANVDLKDGSPPSTPPKSADGSPRNGSPTRS